MANSLKFSPWGEVQTCEEIYPSIYDVTTAGHGGIMVAKDMAQQVLSREAIQCGFAENGYVCFEEDTQWAVVERELLDKKLWQIPDKIRDKAKYEEYLNDSLKTYNPDYWQSRNQNLQSIIDNKRYVVHDFLIGSPVLIDRQNKNMNFYSKNMYGQIYNLQNPEVVNINLRKINGLIKRTQNFDYYRYSAKTIDCYIFKYLMTTEQQQQCKKNPGSSLGKKIAETNDFKEAIKTMCEWSYEENYFGEQYKKDNCREQNLKIGRAHV